MYCFNLNLCIFHSLLGKFGGFNRSAIIQPYKLNAQKQFNNDSKKPKIFISFEKHPHQLMEIDIAPVSFALVYHTANYILRNFGSQNKAVIYTI